MAFSRHFIHTCTIQSYSSSQDAVGAETRAASSSQTKIACRFVLPKGRSQFEPMQDLGQMIQTDALLFVDRAVLMSTEDEILSIALAADGSVVDAGPFEVLEVAGRNRRSPHHIRARLKRVS
jgi:hypothetical protein